MTKSEAKQRVAQRVEDVQGCKATELAAMSVLIDVFEHFELPSLLEEMIEEDLLVEVEYTLPHLQERIKSFLLPKGSVCTLRSHFFRRKS